MMGSLRDVATELITEQANEITRLTAENEQLRIALGEFVKLSLWNIAEPLKVFQRLQHKHAALLASLEADTPTVK